jgi:hypothetical protein
MAGGYKLWSTGEVVTATNLQNYVQNQTVMVFASATARTTALSGVLAEGMCSYRLDSHVFEVYNGTAWVASETNLTTKGDIAVYSTAPDRLPVGTDGQALFSYSGASTGLLWQNQFMAGRNKILNGDFAIWQRGTSFANPTSGSYTADRYIFSVDGTGATRTISQQSFTPGAAPVSGYESPFFFRISDTVASSGGTYKSIAQRIEDVRTFAGQVVTLSFWAKADTTRNITPQLIQSFGSGGSTDIVTSGSAISLTTSWVRYTQTFTVPSISGKTLGANSYLNAQFSLPLNTTMTIDFWGIQVEAGSVATPFTTATGNLANELQACRRYLPIYMANTTVFGYAYSTNSCVGSLVFDTPARVAPTGITIPALSTFTAYNSTNTSSTPSGISLNIAGTNGASILFGQTAIGGTPVRLEFTSGYILFTGCEL